MKDNRYSMAPKGKNTGLSSSSSSNNLQSSMKINPNNNAGNDSKSRKSSNQMLYPRATTFSSLTKSSDPRPIKDSHFQDECIDKICSFLVKYGYERMISKKDLQSPQAKDFMSYFTFMVLKTRPDWNFVINKLDEDVIPMLNDLRYPGYITKSHLIAVGAPNTWPHLLAVLAWLAELGNYLKFDADQDAYAEGVTNNSEMDVDDSVARNIQNSSQNQYGNSLNDYLTNTNNHINPSNINTIAIAGSLSQQEKIFEQCYKDFVYEGYKQTLTKGDNFTAVESFQKRTEDLVKLNYSNADKLKQETINLDKLIEELEKNYPTLNETKYKLEVATRDLNTLKMNLDTQEKNLNEFESQLEMKIKLYDSKCAKYDEDVKVAEELEEVVRSQKVSFEDYEKLKHTKVSLDKQTQNLSSKKLELADLIWNIKNKNENFWNTFYDKLKSIIQIIEKLQIEKEKLVYLENIQNMCEREKEKIFQLDIAEINSKYHESNLYLKTQAEMKMVKKKERDDYLINLRSDLRKLGDKIAEAREMLSQRDLELERENNILAIEKEKYSQILIQKNEEIKKLNESIQKVTNILSEKEREVEEAKNLEISLGAKCNEEEEAANAYIKELEAIYLDTYKQVDHLKNENVNILRSNHKNFLRSFEKIKGLMGNEN